MYSELLLSRILDTSSYFFFEGPLEYAIDASLDWIAAAGSLLQAARVKKLGPFRLTSALLNSGVNSLSSSQLLLLLLLEKLSKSPYRRLFSFKMRKLDRLRPKGWLAFLAQHFLILTNDHMTAKLQKLCKSNACTKGWFAMVIKHPF